MSLVTLIAAVSALQTAAPPPQTAPEASNTRLLRPLQGALSIRQDEEDGPAQEVMAARPQFNFVGVSAQVHMEYMSLSCDSVPYYSVNTDHIEVECRNSYRYTYPWRGAQRGSSSMAISTQLFFYGNMWNIIYETGEGGRLLPSRRACFAQSLDLSNLQSDVACEALWAQRRSDFVQSMQWARENQAEIRFIAARPRPDGPLIIVDYRVR